MGLRMEGTLRDRTADHLAELILAGEWATGDYLPPEGELTHRLGVSRTAFREAMSQLEARGLVEVRHGVGTRVAERSREAVAGSLTLLLRRSRSGTRDLLEARRILETEAAGLAAERASPSVLDSLDAALESMRRPTASPEEYTEGDLRFHIALVLASQNAVLAALAESLREALRESISATFEVDGRTARRLADHERILAAVRSGDPAAARAAVARHLAATEETLRRLGRLATPAPSTPSRAREAAKSPRTRKSSTA
jgi:GntR family transcriptional repressor for pyruvate dehydrogenase complex